MHPCQRSPWTSESKNTGYITSGILPISALQASASVTYMLLGISAPCCYPRPLTAQFLTAQLLPGGVSEAPSTVTRAITFRGLASSLLSHPQISLSPTEQKTQQTGALVVPRSLSCDQCGADTTWCPDSQAYPSNLFGYIHLFIEMFPASFNRIISTVKIFICG